MEDPKLLTLLTLIFSAGISWGVVKYQSGSNVKRVEAVEKDAQDLKIEVAVLKSKQEDHGSRMDQFVSALEAMEARIIARMKELFEAIKRNG